MRKKQGYNARLDESLGERNRKKSPASKIKRTTKRAVTLSPDINQHKRMAMGEDVLTGKMIKRAKGGMAGRRKESEGMEKAKGRRKYAAVGTMDKGKKTAPVKKRRGGRAPAPRTARGGAADWGRQRGLAVDPGPPRGLYAKKGGTAGGKTDKGKKTKQRGGRTAADSARPQPWRPYRGRTTVGRLPVLPAAAKGGDAKTVKKRAGGRTAADSARAKKAGIGSSDKYMRRPPAPAKMGRAPKQRGGRTAADSARAAARTHPRGSWATRLPRSLLKKGGRAPATTGVKLNMGAPKVKTITARGMGAALRGGQFRENT
jgi:hypothetical protein